MLSSESTTPAAGGRHGSPWRAAGTAVVLALALFGAGLVGAAVRTTAEVRPPQPAPGAFSSLDPAAPDPDLVDGSAAEGALPRSAPRTIDIPAIGVAASIMSLGVHPDGTVQVPPLDQAQFAGWYEPGPSPGETGNAVIVGHVDSAEIGPAVFFDLGAVQPGATITVSRRDGRKATFRVDAVRSYPKTEFPTELVYGPADRPQLRVITCGGLFDEESADYPDNVIVFATLLP